MNGIINNLHKKFIYFSKKRKIYKIIYLYILFSLNFFSLFAQNSFQQEKEIKLSGKYYYGEAAENDTLRAMKSSKAILMNKIAQDYLNKKITTFSYDSIIFIKNIQFLNNPYGNKWKSLAYTLKSNINGAPDTLKQLIEIKEIQEVKSVDKKNFNVDVKGNSNDVVQKLTEFNNTSDLFNYLHVASREGKLIYGAKESLFNHPELCYVIVSNSLHKIIAVLSMGSEKRTNLQTMQEVSNFKNEFQKSDYLWVLVF